MKWYHTISDVSDEVLHKPLFLFSDVGVFKRVFAVMYNDLRASPWQCIKPIYPNRMVLLILGNVSYTLNSNLQFCYFFPSKA